MNSSPSDSGSGSPINRQTWLRHLHQERLVVEDLLAGIGSEPGSPWEPLLERAHRLLQQNRALHLLAEGPPTGPPELAEPQDTSLDACLRAASQPFAAVMEQKKLRFEVDVPEKLRAPLAPGPLELIVHLMLESVVRGAWECSIKLTAQAGEPGFCLSDTGSWRDVGQLENEPEAQDTPEENQLQPLRLAKALIEKYGGQLDLVSNKGEPNRMEVRFSASAPQAEPKPHAHQAPVDGGEKPRLLVVDDDPGTCGMLELHLSEHFQVFVAQNGLEGLRRYRAEKVDAVLCDLWMPEVNGVDLLAEVREHEDLHQLPVVFLTSEESPERLINLMRMGANDYLIKPVNLEELAERLKLLISRSKEFVDLSRRFLESEALVRRAEDGLTGLRWALPLLAQCTPPPESELAVFTEALEVTYLSGRLGQQVGLDLTQRPALEQLLELDWSGFLPLVRSLGQCFALRLKPAEGQPVELACFLVSGQGGLLVSRPGQTQWNQRFEEAELFQVGAQAPRSWAVLEQIFQQGQPAILCRFEPELTARFPGLGKPAPQVDLRCLVWETMDLCVRLWSRHQGADKLDLAERSGLWSVSLDKKGCYRAKTLDRYLDLHKVPEHPRTATVLSTADFVGSQLPLQAAEQEKLSALVEQIKGLEQSAD